MRGGRTEDELAGTPPGRAVIERIETALAERYRIERELGEGGMATVYLADDLKHNRKVALKVLKPDLAQMLGKERFLTEIETTANLQHPNILPLFDSGEADGFLFYVMPYVEGESLRDRLDREGQFGIANAVRIGSEIAEALDHAHRAGVVHRDIKPANILLSDGRPLVADFGIALAVGTAGGARLTETGLSLGTPFYMSPEQAMGDQPVGAASDQYALGCLLYEMLVGEPPHTGGSAQAVLARIITGGATAPVEQRASIPPNVDGAIRKSLERVPVDRFGTARELAAALGDPGFRYGETAGEAAPGVPRRTVGAAVLVAGLMGATAGLFGAGALGIGGGGSADGFNAAARPLQVTFSGRAHRPAISPDGQWVAHAERSDCGWWDFVTCRYSVVVRSRDGGQPLTVVDDLLGVWDLRFSPDGMSLAFDVIFEGESRPPGVYTVSRLGGAVRPVADADSFDFDADGASIWTASSIGEGRSTLRRLSFPEGVLESEMEVEAADVMRMRTSPDGRYLLLIEDGAVVLLSREGEFLARTPVTHRDVVGWMPDGRGVAFFEVGAVREDDLVLLEVTDDQFGERSLIRGGIPTDYRGDMDVALETGDVVYVQGASAPELYAVDLTDPDRPSRRFAGGTTWYGEASAYDPSTIFYQRGDAIGDNVYRYDLTTGVETALTEEPTAGGSTMRFSADGRRAVYNRTSVTAEVAVGVIELPSGRHSLHEHDQMVQRMIPVGSAGIVGLEVIGGRSVLRWLDTPDSEPVTIRAELPRSTQTSIDVFAVSPDDTTLAVIVEEGTRSILGRVPLEGGEIVPLAEVTLDGTGDLVQPKVLWVRDGIRLVRWLLGDDAPSVWAWSDERGELERIIDVPVPCTWPTEVTIDPSSSLMACSSENPRTDLFILPGSGR